MGKIDIIYGLILGSLSLVFFSVTLSLPQVSGGINPRTYPLVVITALFALSTVLVYQGARKALGRTTPGERTLPRGGTAIKLVLLVAGSLLYTAIMELVGYVLVTPLLAALAMYLFGERKPVRIVLVSLITATILYFVFRGVFRVPLPRSIIW